MARSLVPSLDYRRARSLLLRIVQRLTRLMARPTA